MLLKACWTTKTSCSGGSVGGGDLMKEWKAELKGDKFDLEDLPSQFSSPDVTVCEEEGKYYLKSEEFNSLEDATAVRAVATELGDLINGTMMVHNSKFRPIELEDRFIQVDEDGKQLSSIVFAAASVGIRTKASAVALRTGEAEEPPKGPSEAERHLSVARKNTTVADALRFYRKQDWYSLYKAYEIIQEDVGGKHFIVQNGWATKGRVDCFTQTAQSRDALGDDARHAGSKYPPPKKPMLLSEARALLRSMLQSWIRSKEASTRQ